MENQKERHGCVTAWLILMIIANSLTALMYLLGGGMIADSLPDQASGSLLIVLALLGVANVVFAVLLFQWKKIGFWGFLVTSVIGVIVNISSGFSVGQSMLGLIGIAILYAILQIKKDNVSAWEQME